MNWEALIGICAVLSMIGTAGNVAMNAILRTRLQEYINRQIAEKLAERKADLDRHDAKIVQIEKDGVTWKQLEDHLVRRLDHPMDLINGKLDQLTEMRGKTNEALESIKKQIDNVFAKGMSLLDRMVGVLEKEKSKQS